MDQEPRVLRSDILAPDDVVVLLDGTPKTVADSIRNNDSLKTLNYRLFSIKPSELDDASKVRRIIQQSIASIEAGVFDSMFSQAAILSREPGSERLKTASSIRDRSLEKLQHLLIDEQAFDQLIQRGKKALLDIRAVGIHATPDDQYEKATKMLTSDQSPLTASIERLFTSERIPLVLFSEENAFCFERYTKHDGRLRLSDAAHVFLSSDFSDHKPNKGNLLPLAFSQIVLDQVTCKKLGILLDAEIPTISRTDPTKMKYALDRKRKEIEKHNKTAGSLILMFPDAIDTARLKANNPELGIEHHGNTSQLAELHHLLTYYKDASDQSKIRDRFDHAQSYYSSVMQTLDERIDTRLNEAKLPPCKVLHADEEQQLNNSPITPERAIALADNFARTNLPDHYKLRSYLQPTTDHRIALKLTNDAGDTVEKVIRTGEKNAEHALDIKRRVQAHLLDIPGIVPYRSPMKEGTSHVGLDEFIPASPPRARITPKYGEYRLKLDWREPREEILIPLGVHYAAENRDEADRRAEAITQQLEQARQDHAGHTHLPLTKRDIIDQLRLHVQHKGGKWDERTHGEIDQFPAMLRFPFAQRGHQQDSWLQIEDLRTDGDPNYTWVLPINVVVNGQRLANASTHVNLHVRDRNAAEERAIETVNRLMQQVSALPANAQWAVDPERPTHLLELTESARNAAHNLIDTNRLTDKHDGTHECWQRRRCPDNSVVRTRRPFEGLRNQS